MRGFSGEDETLPLPDSAQTEYFCSLRDCALGVLFWPINWES